MRIKHHPLVQFDRLQLPNSSNYCLVTLNPLGKRQYLAPSFDISATQLQQTFMQLMQQQPRVTLLCDDKGHLQYVQRSALFHFPDLIDIEFVTVHRQTSRVLLYSRSLYGYYDFGINCQRVKKWLSLFNAKLK